MSKSLKKAVKYMKDNPVYHASVHSIGGIGVGILVAGPLAGVHPVRWGVAFVVVAVLGHLYAWLS